MIDSGDTFTSPSHGDFRTDPGPGGSRVRARASKASKASKPGKVSPVPVTIAAPELTAAMKARHALTTPTRLGSPVALLMLGGLALVYYALHSFDKKYGSFNGSFAGLGAIPADVRDRVLAQRAAAAAAQTPATGTKATVSTTGQGSPSST